MESASVTAPSVGAEVGDKGLKKNAIGYWSSVVIGVASTAPGYSLAAVLGFIVLEVGFQAPAVMWVSFLPMLFIAMAYMYMNRADPDCGTTFTWVTRALGPYAGWMGGWAIVVADIIVMANLAEIAGLYTYLLFGWDDPTTFAIVSLGVVWIVIMTTITTIGIELSARTQRYLLGAEILTLAVFAVVALIKVYGGDAAAGSVEPELSWFSPFAIDSSGALVAGVLIGVFIYWGWDSLVTVNEETEDSANVPGRAAITATIILVGIYVLVSVAAVAFGGAEFLAENADAEDALGALGTDVLGEPWDNLVIIAVLTSAAASTQTTILPTARTTLSMAVEKAMPASLGRVHPRFLTPHVSTILMGALSIVWYVGLKIVSENILFDSIAALGLMIAFYYGITGFACAVYYRTEFMQPGPLALVAGAGLVVSNILLVVATLAELSLTVGALLTGVPFAIALVAGAIASAGRLKAFFLAGVCPVLGGMILSYVFFRSCLDLKEPENSTAGDSWLGLGPPLVIGVGFLLVGVVLMLLWMRGHPLFFKRKPETFTPPPSEPPAASAPAGGS